MTAKKRQSRTPWPLRNWVALGTAVTTGAGIALLLVFARLQAGKWIWTDGFYLNGTQWFDAARTTVTLVGIIGLGGAAFLAYRKQRSTEASHRLEEASALRNRYTTCAEQLGHDTATIRLAGVYALASLADDWHTFGNDDERQMCIDLLCAYLRSDRVSSAKHSTAPAPRAALRPRIAGRRALSLASNSARSPQVDGQEQEVRRTIVSVIRDHTLLSRKEKTWAGCQFNLNSADLSGLTLIGVDFSHADLTNANLTDTRLDCANLSGAELAGANLTNADLTDADLTRANAEDADFTGAGLSSANFTGARLVGANLSGARFISGQLSHANLSTADMTDARLMAVNLVGAILSYANLTHAKLMDANLTDAKLSNADLYDADLTEANLTGADFTGAELAGANMTGIIYLQPPTGWPDSISLPPSGDPKPQT